MALSHRTERIAEQVREELSQILAAEVADPGIGLVTITRVKVTPDLSLARIYWTMMGSPEQRKQTGKALARASAYIRYLLSTRLTLRRSPEVQFLFDKSVEAQDRIEQILQDLKREEAARTPPEAPGTPDAGRDAPSAPDAPPGDHE